MKIYWVLGYDAYYPNIDNFVASFATREEAEKHIEHLRSGEEWPRDYYVIIDISDRL